MGEFVRTFKLREIDRQRLRKIAIMSRRIFQAARPCLRKLESPAHAQPPAGALVASKFSTSSNYEYAARAEAVKMVSDPRFPPEHLPKTKPPSARPVETRKTQMIRAYTSLLRSTPLMLFFQHNNLTAVEWTAVRRELGKAIRAVSTPSLSVDISDDIRLQVVRTNMLNVAMKIVEFHDPEAAAALETTPRTSRGPLVHDLSQVAYKTIKTVEVPPQSVYGQIEPLMVGPMAALTIPAVSPQHLAAALSILSPVAGKFPAPKKRKNPGYHEFTVQSAISKLVLVGGRVEGKTFDQSGLHWVGGIEGGIDGLRAQLVTLLQSAGLGITPTLEGPSKSLWLTVESRKTQLEEDSGQNKSASGGEDKTSE